MDIHLVYEFLDVELTLSKKLLKKMLESHETPFVSELIQFFLGSKNKMLRPALLFLSFRASGGSDKDLSIEHDLIKAAVAMELMHRASLLHDDVLDQSEYRHERLSFHKKWSPEIAITFGNFIYAQAFRMIATVRDIEILKAFTKATDYLCEGELRQVCQRKNLDFSREEYETIIQRKTASLFSTSCFIGAKAAGSTSDLSKKFYDFGKSLGIGFQMIDDMRDFVSPVDDSSSSKGKKGELGKNPGQDLFSGDVTLPLIHLLNVTENKKEILELFKKNQDGASFLALREMFLKSEALEMTRNDINIYVKRAKSFLDNMPSSESVLVLEKFVNFLIKRLDR
ncbi:hypothetical protein AB834_05245 [PVC group bacterium (ex Bugula neritina AB1)]|nr:hypothetical protein AB834_05245 [PVC group bacterium (ex Bugula neritina AB1)]